MTERLIKLQQNIEDEIFDTFLDIYRFERLLETCYHETHPHLYRCYSKGLSESGERLAELFQKQKTLETTKYYELD